MISRTHAEYLSLALQNGLTIEDNKMVHFTVADLLLPTGKVVACDPFVNLDISAFKFDFPPGKYPVILSIAQLGNDQRVAFATIRFSGEFPITWKMMTGPNQDPATLKPGHIFGYGVDSGTGCFMDESAAHALVQKMKDQPDYYETMMAEMDKTYRHTWSWLDLKIGEYNLVAFSSGFGDGLYATYCGFDSESKMSVLVTDFSVIPSGEKSPAGS